MSRAQIIDVDHRAPFDRPPRFVCECLGEITWGHLERGYHGCGRLLHVEVDAEHFGAGR